MKSVLKGKNKQNLILAQKVEVGLNYYEFFYQVLQQVFTKLKQTNTLKYPPSQLPNLLPSLATTRNPSSRTSARWPTSGSPNSSNQSSNRSSCTMYRSRNGGARTSISTTTKFIRRNWQFCPFSTGTRISINRFCRLKGANRLMITCNWLSVKMIGGRRLRRGELRSCFSWLNGPIMWIWPWLVRICCRGSSCQDILYCWRWQKGF